MKDLKGMNALLKRLDKETDKIDERVRFLILRLWQWGIERISEDAVRKSVSNYFVARVPFQFFISHSSASTGPGTPHSKKRHPDWHNRTGGTVHHIIECCIEVDRLVSLWGYVDENERIEDEPRDIVLAATLITDTHKNGLPWGEGSVKKHGEIAAGIWERVAIGCGVPRGLRAQIAEAVFWHYGRYTPVQNKKTFQELPDLVKIVHILDACSANRDKVLIYRPIEEIPSPESLT